MGLGGVNFCFLFPVFDFFFVRISALLKHESFVAFAHTSIKMALSSGYYTPYLKMTLVGLLSYIFTSLISILVYKAMITSKYSFFYQPDPNQNSQGYWLDDYQTNDILDLSKSESYKDVSLPEKFSNKCLVGNFDKKFNEHSLKSETNKIGVQLDDQIFQNFSTFTCSCQNNCFIEYEMGQIINRGCDHSNSEAKNPTFWTNSWFYNLFNNPSFVQITDCPKSSNTINQLTSRLNYQNTKRLDVQIIRNSFSNFIATKVTGTVVVLISILTMFFGVFIPLFENARPSNKSGLTRKLSAYNITPKDIEDNKNASKRETWKHDHHINAMAHGINDPSVRKSKGKGARRVSEQRKQETKESRRRMSEALRNNQY